MAVSCDLCGAQLAESEQSTELLAWTATMVGGRTRHTCPACTRAEVRTIEAKLELGVG